MHVAVYLSLMLPVPAAVSARWLAARLDPRVATWLLTAAAVLLAATSGIALTALAATAIGRIPLVAALGHWSVQVLRRDTPASPTLALFACLLLAAAITAGGWMIVSRTRALVDAARTARRLPAMGPMVVVDDPVPDAYALPGWPGRVVVSTGMLDALGPRERCVLLAHEQAHLAAGHPVFVALAQLAAATNPLLRPLATAVHYTVERWADEQAAAAVGDRRLVARTIARAALLSRHHQRASTLMLPVAPGSLRRAGPVPRRVAALLTAPPPGRRVLLAVAVTLLVLAVASSIEATRDLHILFELAEVGAR